MPDVVTYGPGGFDTSKPNNNVIGSVTLPPDSAQIPEELPWVVDFGNGKYDASVFITDTSVMPASKVRAFLSVPPDDTDRPRDEYWVENLTVRAGNIVPSVGFTVYAKCNYGIARGQFTVNYSY